MVRRRVYDTELHVYFVTFSCYKRRRYLKTDLAKRIVVGELGRQLARHDGIYLGYVIMPNHVHVCIWFSKQRQLSRMLNKWKEESSRSLKKLFRTRFPKYWSKVHDSDPIWNVRSYGFNLWSKQKIEEKIDYMHRNPTRAKLVKKVTDWNWSSARWYVQRRSVGLPIKWPPGLELD